MELGYSGNREIFIKIKNHLYDEGFNTKDAVHLGDDKYEFTNVYPRNVNGIGSISAVLACIKDGEIKYQVKNIGWFANN